MLKNDLKESFSLDPKVTPLPKVWEMCYTRPGELPNFRDSIPGKVPGNILDDLEKAGLIPDPFVGENFRACAWTEDFVFWYRTTIEFPKVPKDETLILCFDGLDTYCEIFVDTQSLGKTNNMFCRYRFELDESMCRGGMKAILVRIDPWKPTVIAWAEKHGVEFEKMDVSFEVKERCVSRKSQMVFGWDNTPRLPAGGIYRKAYLEIRNKIRVSQWTWRVVDGDPGLNVARIEISGEVEIPDQNLDTYSGLEINILGVCGNSSFAGSSPVNKEGAFLVFLDIESPKWWWPNGYGDAYLYSLQVTLMRDSEILDKIEKKIGLRTVTVRTTPIEKRKVFHRIGIGKNRDLDGGSLGPWTKTPVPEGLDVEVHPFEVRVNGRRIFLKGASWQPSDVRIGIVSQPQNETLLRAAKNASMNVIRIWGGGTVESDDFYESCSEKGILVFQDFFFASAQYPRDEAFLKVIEHEVKDIVLRLRNFTCLAFWCGDNESDMVDHDRGLDPQKNPINKKIIPRVLKLLDPQDRYYHPSSPSGGDHPRSDWGGDKRNWGPWHPENNFIAIRQEEARLISEGGSYALPSFDSTKKMIPEARQFPLGNKTWRLHSGDVDLYARTFWEMSAKAWTCFGQAHTIEETVEISQFAQAWGYKLLVERCRQQKGECGGIILWKMNDTWPCLDGGLYDHGLKPRLAYSFVAEAFKSLTVSLSQDLHNDKNIQGWLVNDGTAQDPIRIFFRILNAETGKLVSEDSMLQAAPEDGVLRLFIKEVSGYDPQKTIFEIEARNAEATLLSFSHYTLDPRPAYTYFKHVRGNMLSEK